MCWVWYKVGKRKFFVGLFIVRDKWMSGFDINRGKVVVKVGRWLVRLNERS